MNVPHCRVKVLVFGAIAFAVAIFGVASVCAGRMHSVGHLFRHGVAPRSSLLTLAGEQLLVWDDHGSVQLRSATGVWRPGADSPLRRVWAAAADGAGFLAAGSSKPAIDLVVLFGPNGDEQRRWVVHEPVFSVGVTSHRRWAATQAGFLELLPNGRIGSVVPYVERSKGGAGSIAKLFDYGGKTVICYGADLSMAHHAPSTCQTADGAWRFEGRDTEPPIVCGPWLIAHDGERLEELVVHSISTGEIGGRRTYGATPSFACSGADSIVVGERGLEELELPLLATK